MYVNSQDYTIAKNCESYKQQGLCLEKKVNQLKKENLKILDTIQPYPEPDVSLIQKMKQRRK